MKEIQYFPIASLRVQEDFGFQMRVEAKTSLLTEEGDGAIVAEYKASLTHFDDTLKNSDSNPVTIEVQAADHFADSAWRNLSSQIRLMKKHPSEAVRMVADEAKGLLDKYGDITRMPYNEEYGRMHNLLQDLALMSAEKQKQIYIVDWVADLKKGYDDFMAADKARNEESTKRGVGLVKEARILADEAYQLFVKRINALALLQGEEKYAPFIDQVNEIISQTKAVLATRRTKAASKPEDETNNNENPNGNMPK